MPHYWILLIAFCHPQDCTGRIQTELYPSWESCFEAGFSRIVSDTTDRTYARCEPRS